MAVGEGVLQRLLARGVLEEVGRTGKREKIHLECTANSTAGS